MEIYYLSSTGGGNWFQKRLDQLIFEYIYILSNVNLVSSN